MRINKTRVVVMGFAAAGILLITNNHNPTTNGKLEKNLQIPITIPLRDMNLPLNHIDPNLLQAYRTPYDAPLLTDSIGKIIDAELGYFKDGRFAVPTEEGGWYWARHIQKPEDIFDSGHFGMPNYYWELTIEKPKNMRGVDYVKKHSQGLRVSRKLAGKPADLLIFPTLNYGKFCDFISAYQIPVWNKDIGGLYKKLGTDLNDPDIQPQYHLYQIIPPIKSLKELK